MQDSSPLREFRVHYSAPEWVLYGMEASFAIRNLSMGGFVDAYIQNHPSQWDLP